MHAESSTIGVLGMAPDVHYWRVVRKIESSSPLMAIGPPSTSRLPPCHRTSTCVDTNIKT